MLRLKSKLPDIVIRRSGIWNSRAPLHNFVLESREIQRNYNVVTLAIYQLRYQADQDNPNRAAQKFLRKVASSGPATANKSWQAYRFSLGRDSEGKLKHPTVSDFSKDLKDALYPVREAAIIQFASLFESFTQCWALNLLLSKLENGKGWTSNERNLAEHFSPVHGRHNAPGWPVITQRIPDLMSGLSILPHINKDSATGTDVLLPVSASLNAFRSIKFWRDFRNIVVHSSGLITSNFRDENGAFFEELRMPYAQHMPPLELGKRLKFFDFVFPAMATTHLKAAFWMNNWLENESAQRRGHPHAPSPKRTDFFDGTSVRPLPLLISGDHSESYNWASDGGYRAKFL